MEAISERTHIKVDHLRGIENGDLSLLPARAYVSGFVKTYAEFLDLEAPPIVARFREDVGLEKPVPVDPKGFETAEDRNSLDQGEMSLWGVLAVLAFILWCSWQIVRPGAVDGDVATPAGFPPPPVAEETEAILDPLADPARTATSGDDIPARLITEITPVYPRMCELRSDDVETVEATFNITADGRVAGARVLSSSNSCFDRAAINALKRWRFEPRRVDGRPRPSYDQVKAFRFNRPA